MRRFIGNVPGKLVTAYYAPKGWPGKIENERQEIKDKIKAGFDVIESEL